MKRDEAVFLQKYNVVLDKKIKNNNQTTAVF